MKVHIKVFPIAGLCSQSQNLDLALEQGSFNEMLMGLQSRLGVNQGKFVNLMFLHNGRALDRRNDVIFQDGDQLWLLPLISGG